MAIVIPPFGIVSPSEATPFNKFGEELRLMTESLSDVLAQFDYNGADPNLVLARVNALEAWRATIAAKVTALETATAVTVSTTAITNRPNFTISNQRIEKDARGNIDISFAVSGTLANASTIADITVTALRPTSQVWIQPITPLPVGTAAAHIRVETGGILQYYGPSATGAHVRVRVR